MRENIIFEFLTSFNEKKKKKQTIAFALEVRYTFDRIRRKGKIARREREFSSWGRIKLCVFCVILRPFILRLAIKRPSDAIVRRTRTLKKFKAQWYDSRVA